MEKYKVLMHKDSKSKYSGGFISKNGRQNNSKAYNHDYYIKNKDKWKKDSEDVDKSNEGEYTDVGSFREISISEDGKALINDGYHFYEKYSNNLFTTTRQYMFNYDTSYRGDKTSVKTDTYVYSEIGLLDRAERWCVQKLGLTPVNSKDTYLDKKRKEENKKKKGG